MATERAFDEDGAANVIAQGSELKYDFQPGDIVMAPWTADGQFYEAEIDDIFSDGQCCVVFSNLPNGKMNVSQTCLVTLLKPAQGAKRRMKIDTSGLRAITIRLFMNWSIKLRTSFNPEIPIWLLGLRYQSIAGSDVSRNQVLEKFRQDFSSRIWLTYRRDFKRLPGSMLTSDRGWGCMLRTGQMMLAQAFLTHYLGREWRWNRTQSDKSGMIHRMIIKWFADDLTSDCPFSVHQLIRMGSSLGKKPGDWFGPSSISILLQKALAAAAPSNPILNNICIYVANDCRVFIQDVINMCTSPTIAHKKSDSITREYGRSLMNKHSTRLSLDYGRSFDINEHGYFSMQHSDVERGPTTTSRRHSTKPIFYGKAMSTINLTDAGNSVTNSPNLGNHPSMDYVNNSSSSFSSNSHHHQFPSRSQRPTSLPSEPSRDKWKSVIIIVPVRLGTEVLNPIYGSCIKSLFRLKSCLGIIGGRPRHSLYFVGTTEDKLIYLDPHNDQKAIDPSKTDFPLDSYHCDFPRKLSIDRMDPSCAIGFYCRTRQEFNELADTIGEVIVPKHTDYPMFVVSEGSASAHRYDLDCSMEQTIRVKHRYIDALGEITSEFDADEFVMI